jgi:hypothetical protein
MSTPNVPWSNEQKPQTRRGSRPAPGAASRQAARASGFCGPRIPSPDAERRAKNLRREVAAGQAERVLRRLSRLLFRRKRVPEQHAGIDPAAHPSIQEGPHTTRPLEGRRVRLPSLPIRAPTPRVAASPSPYVCPRSDDRLRSSDREIDRWGRWLTGETLFQADGLLPRLLSLGEIRGATAASIARGGSRCAA